MCLRQMWFLFDGKFKSQKELSRHSKCEKQTFGDVTNMGPDGEGLAVMVCVWAKTKTMSRNVGEDFIVPASILVLPRTVVDLSGWRMYRLRKIDQADKLSPSTPI